MGCKQKILYKGVNNLCKSISYLKTKLENYKKSKAGFTTIQFILGTLILLAIFVVMLNFVILFWQFLTAGQTESYISRTMSIQGGFLNTAPEGYSSVDGAYVTKSDIETYIKNEMKNSGAYQYKVIIKDNSGNEIMVTQDGVQKSDNVQINYGNSGTLGVYFTHYWVYSSNSSDGNNFAQHVFSIQNVVRSEFKYNYGNWSTVS